MTVEGKTKYDAYLRAVSGRDPVTGDPLPEYGELDPQVRHGWNTGVRIAELEAVTAGRDRLRGKLGASEEVHAQLLEEIFRNAPGDRDRTLPGAVGYIRHLEGETARLRELLDEASTAPSAPEAERYVIFRKTDPGCWPTAHGPYSEAEADRLRTPRGDSESRLKLLLTELED